MAIHGKFWNGYVMINAVDYSAYVKAVTVTYGTEVLDLTCMSNTTKVNGAGIKNWQVEVEFEDDMADNGLDEKMYDLVGAAAFVIKVRPDSGVIAATNPEYTGNVILGSGFTMGGAHGQPLRKRITFLSAGALDRDVTP